MNKKMLSLFFVGSFLLAGCIDKEPKEEVEQIEDQPIEIKNFAEDYEQEDPGQVIEGEEGKREVIKNLYNLNESLESGPFRITVRDVRLSQFEPTTEKVVKYGGYDLGLVSIHLLVENTSKEKAIIYPTQGVVQTDTGNKVDAHFSLSDQIGGEFDGRSAKEGIVYCFFDGDAEEVSEVRYQIEAPHDEDIKRLGEDFEFSFSFD